MLDVKPFLASTSISTGAESAISSPEHLQVPDNHTDSGSSVPVTSVSPSEQKDLTDPLLPNISNLSVQENVSEKEDGDLEDSSVKHIKCSSRPEADGDRGVLASADRSRDDGLHYELYSIMIHSGSALGGHYYAYIK